MASGWIVVSLQPEAKERERRKNGIKQKNEEKKQGEAKLPMAHMEDVLEKLMEMTSESPLIAPVSIWEHTLRHRLIAMAMRVTATT